MTDQLISLESRQLKKVISGGQTGADRAGLIVACEFLIETGGWAPNGYRTARGFEPALRELGLVETKSAAYPPRTALNVKNSDATIRFATNFRSSGEVLTLRLINKFNKPHFDVDLNIPTSSELGRAICNFIVDNDVQVLNVAGNADRDKLTTHYDKTCAILRFVFTELQQRGKLSPYQPL